HRSSLPEPMKIPRLILFVMLVIAVNGLFAWLSNLPQEVGPDVPDGKLNSVSFAPFREGQSPLTRVYPTNEQIDEDLRMLADKTRTVRTYSSLSGLRDVPAMARKHGLKLILGAWLGGPTIEEENRAEIAQLIKAANEYPDVIERVIVGNEVLLRGEMDPQQLLQYIRQVKKAVKQPVSYADVWSFYLRYPEIAQEVDFFTVHILPYWEDEPLTVEKTAAHIEKNYRRIRETYPGKPILIGESGWPGAGRQRGWAVPSVVNEAKFIRSLVQVANKNGFDYNIVEAFNQPWKSKQEGVVGANWGLYSVAREPVFPLTGKVVENPSWPMRLFYAGMMTLLIMVLHVKRTLPLSPLRLLILAGFAQVLSALLVKQFGDYWYTSYDGMERIHAVLMTGLSAVLAALMFRRALYLLRKRAGNPTEGVWIRYLVLGFIAIALFQSQALALHGRYLNIPYPVLYIPVAGILALALIRWFGNGLSLAASLEPNGLFGALPLSERRAGIVSRVLIMTGILLIALETVQVMFGTNYPEAYPVMTDRAYAALMSTLTNSQLLGWAFLIAAAVILLPFRMIAWTLVFMVLAQIAGETYAFMIGHDFIESYPKWDDRFLTAFIYTVTNGQLMLWLASLLILAAPLWIRESDKVKVSGPALSGYGSPESK
ncbi:MAG: glycoside hydrolase family 17 protein, partial [Methylosarcina sp.]